MDYTWITLLIHVLGLADVFSGLAPPDFQTGRTTKDLMNAGAYLYELGSADYTSTLHCIKPYLKEVVYYLSYIRHGLIGSNCIGRVA
jgi:hypothetical protein